MIKFFKILAVSLPTVLFGTGLAIASTTPASVTIQVNASVPTSCEIRTKNNFSQISTDSFVIGSIALFCNTAHDVSIGHGAQTSGGRISIGGATAALNTGLNLVVANSPPRQGSNQIILSGVDSQTALQVSTSFMAQITPSGL